MQTDYVCIVYTLLLTKCHMHDIWQSFGSSPPVRIKRHKTGWLTKRRGSLKKVKVPSESELQVRLTKSLRYVTAAV